MIWHLSGRADPRALPLADRHYNRQKPGTPQFVPPGRCLVLLTPESGALWVTSWPFAEYTKHEWAGAWINSLFRNERPDIYLSSNLILQAVAATRAHYGAPPHWVWSRSSILPRRSASEIRDDATARPVSERLA